MLRGILNFVEKERLDFRRDPVRLRAAIVLPVIQLILLGYAVNLDVKKIPMVVYDADQSVESRRLVERFTSSGYFVLQAWLDDSRAMDSWLDRGDAAFALVIPRGFASDLQAQRTVKLQAIVDGSDAAFGARSLNYAVLIMQAFSRNIVMERLQRMGQADRRVGISVRTRAWFNPELQSRWFFIPGVLALVLMVITMAGTAVSIVREKEFGTMEQLIVTPIRPYEIILGKLIPAAGLGMLDVLLILAIVRFIFRVPLEGSFWLLLGLCALFLLTTLGLGLLISTVAHTQQQAMMTAMFFAMMPMLILSGFVFPIENMPYVIQLITYLLPLRYFFTIVRGIFLKGVGLDVLWDEALALFIFGAGILILSIKRFHKRLE